MKYARLTKEQLEELHVEFTNFLASQQIDKAEWDTLKRTKPEVAEQEIDIFSDLVWEGVLKSARYIEHFSKNHIFLFQFDDKNIDTIVLKTLDTEVDFLTNQGLKWLGNHIETDLVEIRYGAKTFGGDRNGEIFEIIQQGGILSQGELYQQIKSILKK
ncbi:hypothetical protein SAMN02927937_02894 [Paenimyroides aquimaris]|uniref:Histidyl-tRNA synthetase n=1 Tax=Paenimyroides marinum TaxID=1159016 RepID=A0A1H6N105_9FLAO|nr:DUF6495 family protein [Paenimyroides aquimaris]SEI03759.1 hypothetical protein SAMN02927937_02894 [Paenimyroides aquimaris]